MYSNFQVDIVCLVLYYESNIELLYFLHSKSKREDHIPVTSVDCSNLTLFASYMDSSILIL